ncbi:MAG TPA: alpha-glucan family phosphorylase [Anaeromyxobacter sp.]|nr:alpha-glucan family phosphorylase [Anaeromyxobacter sp.]
MAPERSRSLPPKLERLAEVAYDLRLSNSMTLQRVWRRIDPDAWEASANPCMILQHATRESLEEVAGDEELLARLERWLARRDAVERGAGWFGEHHPSELKGVAYFSMEFGLSEALPTYSGGLGILAGDHLKAASYLHVPVVGIGLLYQQGYFRQVLGAEGQQLEALPFNDPSSLPVTPVLDSEGRWPRVRLELPGRTLLLRVWRAQVGSLNLYLLDSNHPLNAPWDRGITSSLYSAVKETRLLQELVLGVGGWRLLEKLGIEVDVCHLNEGHAAFAVLARAARFAERRNVPFATALRATRAGNVFTTHTPVEAAFDRFDPAMVTEFAGPFIRECGLSNEEFLALGRHGPGEPFNMAYLAMQGSCHANGVSQLHARVSRRLFQTLFPGWPQSEVPVGHVTNGVDMSTWRSEPADELWATALGDYDTWLARLPEAARAVDRVPDEELWDHRAAARQTLVQYVRRRHEGHVRARNAPEEAVRHARHALDPNRLTLGFARRFTGYKRPNLLLTDEERLVRILCNLERPVQLVVAGKAHPNDEGGKAMIQRMVRFSLREDVRDRVVFLEDYDMTLAQHLAAGVDVWINNPRRPLEACGTSGMKMLVNGGLHCSTLDGWWDEAFSPEVGWAIGDRSEHEGRGDLEDSQALYDLIEKQIAPEFYARDGLGVPRAWIRRVRASMTQLTPQFSADRMVKDYVERAYLPAAQAYRRRAEAASLPAELDAWVARLDDAWGTLRFGTVKTTAVDGQWEFELQVYLGEVPAESVAVQLFADEVDGEGLTRVDMTQEAPIHGAVNGFVYRTRVPAIRPAEHFTPRIVPRHPEAFVPAEATRILWWHR